MQIAFRSHEELDHALQDYCGEKIYRRIERTKLDPSSVRVDVEATSQGPDTALRLRLHAPGVRIFVTHQHEDTRAAFDKAMDKLTRRISEVEQRRRSKTRRQGRGRQMQWAAK